MDIMTQSKLFQVMFITFILSCDCDLTSSICMVCSRIMLRICLQISCSHIVLNEGAHEGEAAKGKKQVAFSLSLVFLSYL